MVLGGEGGAGGRTGSVLGFVSDGVFVTAMREKKEVRKGRRNQIQRMTTRRRRLRPNAFLMRPLNDALTKDAWCITLDCVASAVKQTESKSPKKALLILVQYPVLGAPLLQQTLLVLLLVGFLEVPSEDEYPELSTPL